MSSVGKRFNDSKLRWRNFPLFLIRPMIEVGQQGEKKYGTYNFLKGQKVSNCMDSALRHLDAFLDPTLGDDDPESGVSHLAHCAWNCLVALYMIKTRPDLDDRYKLETEEPKKVTEGLTFRHDAVAGGNDEKGSYVILTDGQKLYEKLNP